MTMLKLVSVALLGATGTGKKSLALALTQALATTPTSTSTTTLRWQITPDTPLQRLLAQALVSATHTDRTILNKEPSEFQEALAHQHRFDHTLLLGLDLVPSARTLSLQSTGERSRMDMLLRRSLTQAGVPYQVIYGKGDERMRQALTALSVPPADASSPRTPWVLACDKCSDAVCEHRMLSDLLLKR